MNSKPSDPPSTSRSSSNTNSRKASAIPQSSSRGAKPVKKGDSKKSFGNKNAGGVAASMQGLKKRFQSLIVKSKDSFDAVDPVTKQVRNPSQLFQSHQGTGNDNAGSYQSGNISPSSASESMSDFDRVSSFSFGRDNQQASQTGSSSPSVVSDDEDSFVFGGPTTTDDAFSTTGSVDTSTNFVDFQELDLKKIAEPPQFAAVEEPRLTGKQLEQLQDVDFTITLSETETFFVFDKYDESVKVDDPKIEDIREKNRVYKELVKNKENNRDNYMDKHCQTLEKFYKNKRTNTSKTEYDSAEVQVSAFQIYDDYKEIKEREEREREERELLTTITNKQESDGEEEADGEDDMDDSASVKSGNNMYTKVVIPPYQELVISRAVVQNIFHGRQQQYNLMDNFVPPPIEIPNPVPVVVTQKPVPENNDELGEDSELLDAKENEKEEERNDTEERSDIDEVEEDTAPPKPEGILTSIWEYNCDLTANFEVNNFTWNKENKNILAAAYGSSSESNDVASSRSGMILCWSVKNPATPERILKVEGAGVSSVNFSSVNPSILAAGLDDGTVAIYDIRRKENTPVLETIKSHTGTVWDLKWVNRGKDVGERLHSVGVDGRVHSWSIKKGLEASEIMRLKRIGRANEIGGDAMISRESGGMSIDFSPVDSNFYLVGTEDGGILKCSCSYNEHPIETYLDHTGPVYSVRWNPYAPDIFISCSADWTVKIWNQESLTPIYTLESYSESKDQRSYSVTDVAWSKYSSTMFATSSIVGNLEVWDLSHSTVRPKYSKTKPGLKLNCTLFAEDVPIVLVGDNKGSIEVLRCEGASNLQQNSLDKILQT